MRLCQRLLLAAGLMALPVSSAQANVIINGGFENPNIPTGTFALFTSIPGWSLTTGTFIEIQDHVAGSPYEGDQFVELDSTGNSGMIQASVATVPLQPYTFSFAYSPRPGVAASSNGVDVYFNGALLIALAQSGIGLQNTLWTPFSFVVTPTGATSSVEFRASGTSNSLGGYIDDVRLTAVPEPMTMSLLALGLCGAVARRFRA
jgi:hypothetical protein